MHMMKNAETVQNVNIYLTETKTDRVCDDYYHLFICGALLS